MDNGEVVMEELLPTTNTIFPSSGVKKGKEELIPTTDLKEMDDHPSLDNAKKSSTGPSALGSLCLHQPSRMPNRRPHYAAYLAQCPRVRFRQQVGRRRSMQAWVSRATGCYTLEQCVLSAGIGR